MIIRPYWCLTVLLSLTAMIKSLAEDFKDFTKARIKLAQMAYEETAQCREIFTMQETLPELPENAVNLADELRTLAERYAYRQGFIDGLSIMAGNA